YDIVWEDRGLEEQSEPIHVTGESVHVGYATFALWRSWWSNRLSSNPLLDRRANARFLFVRLTVRNDDTKTHTFHPSKLVDELGSEYECAPEAWLVEGTFGLLETLNPGVSKEGILVFDVPPDRAYALRVEGGFESSALIAVEPSAK